MYKENTQNKLIFVTIILLFFTAQSSTKSSFYAEAAEQSKNKIKEKIESTFDFSSIYQQGIPLAAVKSWEKFLKHDLSSYIDKNNPDLKKELNNLETSSYDLINLLKLTTTLRQSLEKLLPNITPQDLKKDTNNLSAIIPKIGDIYNTIGKIKTTIDGKTSKLKSSLLVRIKIKNPDENSIKTGEVLSAFAFELQRVCVDAKQFVKDTVTMLEETLNEILNEKTKKRVEPVKKAQRKPRKSKKQDS